MRQIFYTNEFLSASAKFLSAAVILFYVNCQISYAGSPVKDSGASIITRCNDSGIALLKGLAANKTSNVFLSPLSISQAMQIVAAGTEGSSKTEIDKSFGAAGMTPQQTGLAVQSLNKSLATADPGVQIDIANALWSDKEWPLAAFYQELCRTSFSAKTETLNFSSPSAAQTINSWVSEKTHGKIATIVPSGGLPHPGAVITNAVYFHGSWTNQFSPASTTKQPFSLATGDSITLPMMYQSGHFAYSQDDNSQEIALPYGKSGRLEMLILLPHDSLGLDNFVQNMSDASIEDIRAQMSLRQVRLTLPRFHIDYSTDLISPLESMGVSHPFQPSGDFRPMGFPRGCISAIIHKTTLDVDEEGTVATAATGVFMRALAMPAPQNIMDVDHPFLCIIRDTQSKALLFVGAIYSPQPLGD